MTRLCSEALILSTIFIKMRTAVKADRPIRKVISFHQVENTHRNVCAKFESNGPRRLGCKGGVPYVLSAAHLVIRALLYPFVEPNAVILNKIDSSDGTWPYTRLP